MLLVQVHNHPHRMELMVFLCDNIIKYVLLPFYMMVFLYLKYVIWFFVHWERYPCISCSVVVIKMK